MLLGYFEIMSLGRKVIRSYERGNKTEIHTTTYGYFSDTQFYYAYEKVLKMVASHNNERSKLLRKIKKLSKQINKDKKITGFFDRYIECIDRHFNKRMCQKEALKISSLHLSGYLDEFNNASKAIEKELKNYEFLIRNQTHYSDRATQHNRQCENSVDNLWKQYKEIHSRLVLDVKLLGKYCGLLYKLKVFFTLQYNDLKTNATPFRNGALKDPLLQQIMRVFRAACTSKMVWVSTLIVFLLAVSYIFRDVGSKQIPSTLKKYQQSEPAPVNKVYNSLRNGTILKSRRYYLKGYGTLRIENGTNMDAVAKLIRDDSRESICNIYIKSNSSYTIRRISNGTYELYFSHGNDWDSSLHKFMVDASFSKFEDSFEFTTRTEYEDDGTRTIYKGFTVTLHTTIGGRAKTDRVSDEEFNRY